MNATDNLIQAGKGAVNALYNLSQSIRDKDLAERLSTIVLEWDNALRTMLSSRLDGGERAELAAISAAIGTVRFMDPPDGGDVSLAEQIRRMKAALDKAEAALSAPEVVRTISGETVNGFPVRAYVSRGEFGDTFASHWSTIPEHAKPERLFTEADLLAALRKMGAR